MQTNEVPKYDQSDNPTSCCPRFKTEGWDDQELHFEDKLFVKAKTKSLFHIPLNINSVYIKTFKDIQAAHADSEDNMLVLSYDPSAWTGEHYFAVNKDVPGHEMVTLNGDYLTKVFEGPYKNISTWEKEMQQFVEDKGKKVRKTYYFYTTCPKCAKVYGKNYVVAVSEVQ